MFFLASAAPRLVRRMIGIAARDIDALEDVKSTYAGEGPVTPIVCSEIAPALKKEGCAGILGQCSEAADVVLLDEQREVKGRFGVRLLPTTFLIDANFCSRSRATSVGALCKKEFRRRLRKKFYQKAFLSRLALRAPRRLPLPDLRPPP